jgi:hypothetical protein
MNTAGEAREALMDKRAKARTKTYDRMSKRYEQDDLTESDLILGAFDEGWNAGYAAGYQQALDSINSAWTDMLRAQRTAIMSTGLNR